MFLRCVGTVAASWAEELWSCKCR